MFSFLHKTLDMVVDSFNEQDWELEMPRKTAFETVTSFVMGQSPKSEDIAFILELLHKHNDPNYRLTFKDNLYWAGWTLLAYATYHGYEGIVKDLLNDEKTNPNIPVRTATSWNGWTPFAIATYQRRYRGISLALLKHKANPDIALGENRPLSNEIVGPLSSFRFSKISYQYFHPIRGILDNVGNIDTKKPILIATKTAPHQEKFELIEVPLLQLVLDSKEYRIARLLLERGADIACLDNYDEIIKLVSEKEEQIRDIPREKNSGEHDAVYLTLQWLKAKYHFKRNEYQEAKEYYQQIIEFDRKFSCEYRSAVFAFLELAKMAKLEKNEERTIFYLDQLIEAAFDPEYEKIGHIQKGLLYLETNRVREAIVCFDKAIQLDKFEPSYHWHKYEAYSLLGDRSQAIASLKKAIQLAERVASDYLTCRYQQQLIQYTDALNSIQKAETILSRREIADLRDLLKRKIPQTVEQLKTDNNTNQAKIEMLQTGLREIQTQQTNILAQLFESREFQQDLKASFKELKQEQDKALEELRSSIGVDIEVRIKDIHTEIQQVSRELEDEKTKLKVLHKKLKITGAQGYVENEKQLTRIKTLEKRIITLENKKSVFELQVAAEEVFINSGNPNLVPFFRILVTGLESLFGVFHDLSTHLISMQNSPSKAKKGTKIAKYIAKGLGLAPGVGSIIKLLIKGGTYAAENALDKRQINIIVNFANTYTKYEASVMATDIAIELVQRYQLQAFQLPTEAIKNLKDESEEAVLKSTVKTPIEIITSYILDQIGVTILNGDLIPEGEKKLKLEYFINAIIHPQSLLEKASSFLNVTFHRDTILTNDGTEWYVPGIFSGPGIRTNTDPVQYFQDSSIDGAENTFRYGYCIGTEKEALERNMKASSNPLYKSGLKLPDPVFVKEANDMAVSNNNNDSSSNTQTQDHAEQSILLHTINLISDRVSSIEQRNQELVAENNALKQNLNDLKWKIAKEKKFTPSKPASSSFFNQENKKSMSRNVDALDLGMLSRGKLS